MISGKAMCIAGRFGWRQLLQDNIYARSKRMYSPERGTSTTRRSRVLNVAQRKPDPSQVTPEKINARQEAGVRLFFLDARRHACEAGQIA